MIAIFLLLLASLAATYAWYIYNTSRHTTNVKMAAGTGVNLQISNTSVSYTHLRMHRCMLM